MRLLFVIAVVFGSHVALAQEELLNKKCEGGCKTILDRCAAIPNKMMDIADSEMAPYPLESRKRVPFENKFESAYLQSERCETRYDVCTAKCKPPKKCMDSCRSKFANCSRVAEKLAKDGIRESKALKYNTPEWKLAYAKGNVEMDKCSSNDRSCFETCANPLEK